MIVSQKLYMYAQLRMPSGCDGYRERPSHCNTEQNTRDTTILSHQLQAHAKGGFVWMTTPTDVSSRKLSNTEQNRLTDNLQQKAAALDGAKLKCKPSSTENQQHMHRQHVSTC
jgi:hypothetical protein